MGQRPETGQSNKPGDDYAIVADEIRSLGKDLVDSALNVLLELGKSNPGSAYVAAKKYIEQKGLSVSDYGGIGITYGFLRGVTGGFVACPGDVVIYAQVDKAKTDDVLLLFYLDDRGVARAYHARVLNFDLRGGIEVRDLNGGNSYWISRMRILGKLVKIVCFGDPEWHDLIGQMIERQFLEKRMVEELKWTERNEFENKSERVAELKRRIAILASGTR